MSEIICGDALTSLRGLPDGIVQTCVTSPPYFGLRDYGTETILQLDSDPECQHEWIHEGRQIETGAKVAQCKLCHAAKYDYQIGLEDTPEAYIARLVEVFREVKRVLRDDGTLWVNIGDSYAGAGDRRDGKGNEHGQMKAWKTPDKEIGLKPKDLIGIPWLLAFALRADGWYLRSDIIWHKPNCMPESVEDRPTKSHEYIFLLSKNERYFYDADAIREPMTWIGGAGDRNYRTWAIDGRINAGQNNEPNPAGRNKRSVWTVSTMPYSEAHFATFPPKLIEPCILAGTSPRACEHCGAPWERVTSQTTSFEGGSGKAGRTAEEVNSRGKWAGKQYGTNLKLGPVVSVNTLGWQPTCTCDNTGSGACVVLDPFCGAGTVPLVALKYQRQYIGIELNPDYVKLINKRIHTTQPVLWEVGA